MASCAGGGSPLPHDRPPARPEGRANRRAAHRDARSGSRSPAQDPGLRQRNRIRHALQAPGETRHADVLLRSARAMAKRRRRERHRPLEEIPSAKDKTGRHHAERARNNCQTLQRHTPKMPRLQNTSRGILNPQIKRCTSNVSPNSGLRRNDGKVGAYLPATSCRRRSAFGLTFEVQRLI